MAHQPDQKTLEQPRILAPSKLLQTEPGLRATAVRAGLEKDVERITGGRGEDPNKIYSGGWVQDIFDTLNVLQYGVAGVLQGKGFAEGVKTRASFSKELARKYGWGGMLSGLVLDIATDPLTYIAPAKAFAKIPGAVSLVTKSKDAFLGTEIGKAFGKRLIYRFGQDPLYVAMDERRIRNIARQSEAAMEIVRPLAKLDPEIQRVVSRARKEGRLDSLPSDILKKAKPAFDELDRWGEEAVKVGLLSREQYEAGRGLYMPRLYRKFEDPAFETAVRPSKGLFPSKPLSVERSRFMKREDIPLWWRQAAGEIEEAGYPTAEGIVQLINAVENVKFFNKVARRIASAEARDGYKQLKGPRRLFTSATGRKIQLASRIKKLNSSLEEVSKKFSRAKKVARRSGAAVTKDLRRLSALTSRVDRLVAKMVAHEERGAFDAANKVAERARGLERRITGEIERLRGRINKIEGLDKAEADRIVRSLSAQLSSLKALKAGLREQIQVERIGELHGKWVPEPIFDAINEMVRTKSDFQQWTGDVVGAFKYSKVILNPATHVRNIISNIILNSWEGMNPLDPRAIRAYVKAAKEIKNRGKLYREAKEAGLALDTFAAAELRDFLDSPHVRSLSFKARENLRKIADVYQKEEEWAKIAQYIFQREVRGADPKTAALIAERATFNYAQVTPFIRMVRESVFGYPFITFAYKAAPQALRTAALHPTRISNIGKAKQGIEGLSDPEELAAERAVEPPWIKDGFYIKLPIKDEGGRSAYFDLTYILPFGDLLSGQLFERQILRETGLPESPAATAIRKLPFVNLIPELKDNRDFYGDQIFQNSDPLPKQLGDIFRHLVKTMAPPLLADQIPGGYREDGTRRPGVIERVRLAEKGEERGRSYRRLSQELLRNVGIKIDPFDLELQQRFSQGGLEKALTTLLKERGVIREFTQPFTPRRPKE